MDAQEFRRTLGQFATGVTVVTAVNEAGEKIGLTANSFSSLSLEPPLILVCIDNKSDSLSAFRKDVPFTVNILTKEQEDICWAFAKKGTDKFNGIEYAVTNDGVPYFPNNVATLHCNVYENFQAGDHVIVTGFVCDIHYDENVDPLLFFRGKITELAEV